MQIKKKINKAQNNYNDDMECERYNTTKKRKGEPHLYQQISSYSSSCEHVGHGIPVFLLVLLHLIHLPEQVYNIRNMEGI